MPISNFKFTLKHCCKTTAHIHQLHAEAITSGLFSIYPSPVLSHILTSLTTLKNSPQKNVSANHSIIYITKIFNLLPNPVTNNYNSIILAHTLCSPHAALTFFLRLRRMSKPPNCYTFVFVLRACGLLQNSHSLATALHAQATKFGFLDDVIVHTTLSGTYARSGDVDGVKGVFSGSLFRDVVSYTTMIDVFVKAGEMNRAMELFDKMPSSLRNVVTFNAMLNGFCKAGDIERAGELFDRMPSSLRDTVSYNIMIDGFVKAGEIARAAELFDGMPSSLRDVVSKNTMMDGFMKTGMINRGRELFDAMPMSMRNVASYNVIIDGLVKAGNIDHATELFDEIPSSLRDVVSYTILIDGFAKAGQIDRARELFDKMPERDTVLWCTLLAGYTKLNRCFEAIELFNSMQISGVQIDKFALAILLSAYTQLGKLAKGKEIHCYIERNGIELDACIGTALVNLYAKMGCIEIAKEVFRLCSEKDVSLWSAMLMGLSMHGHGRLVLQYFSRMLEDGVKPNSVTTLAVLVGCNHSGLINDATRIFMEMESVYGVPLEPQHYGCMVDLLARAGMIKEAREMIDRMPVEADASMWGALLGGCKKHVDVHGSEEAAKNVLQLEPENGAVYSSLVYIYANLERWDDVVKMRRLGDCSGVEKRPGCSIIELGGITHKFFPGDRSHPCTKEIYLMLNDLQLHKSELLKDS